MESSAKSLSAQDLLEAGSSGSLVLQSIGIKRHRGLTTAAEVAAGAGLSESTVAHAADGTSAVMRAPYGADDETGALPAPKRRPVQDGNAGERAGGSGSGAESSAGLIGDDGLSVNDDGQGAGDAADNASGADDHDFHTGDGNLDYDDEDEDDIDDWFRDHAAPKSGGAKPLPARGPRPHVEAASERYDVLPLDTKVPLDLAVVNGIVPSRPNRILVDPAAYDPHGAVRRQPRRLPPPKDHLMFAPFDKLRTGDTVVQLERAGGAQWREWCCRLCGVCSVSDRQARIHAEEAHGAAAGNAAGGASTAGASTSAASAKGTAVAALGPGVTSSDASSASSGAASAAVTGFSTGASSNSSSSGLPSDSAASAAEGIASAGSSAPSGGAGAPLKVDSAAGGPAANPRLQSGCIDPENASHMLVDNNSVFSSPGVHPTNAPPPDSLLSVPFSKADDGTLQPLVHKIGLSNHRIWVCTRCGERRKSDYHARKHAQQCADASAAAAAAAAAGGALASAASASAPAKAQVPAPAPAPAPRLAKAAPATYSGSAAPGYSAAVGAAFPAFPLGYSTGPVPASTAALLMYPADAWSSSMLAPGAASSSLIGPAAASSSLIGPAAASSSLIGPAAASSSLIGPAAAATPAAGPGNYGEMSWELIYALAGSSTRKR